MNTFIWFRTDLRTADNTALHAAAECARQGAGALLGVFVISPEEWKAHDLSPFKVDFMLRNLTQLRKKLKELNVPLVIEHAENQSDVPQIVLSCCQKYNVDKVFCNQEYEVDEEKRDAKTEALLGQHNIEFYRRHDQCIVEPGVVVTQAEKPYTVFTPFKKNWLRKVGSDKKYHNPLPAPSPFPEQNLSRCRTSAQTDPPGELPEFPLSPEMKKVASSMYPEGEEKAIERLDRFVQKKISNYDTGRDFPIDDGTSVLSPYLALGVISPRQCLAKALGANENRIASGNEGVQTWISELAWRDFYRNVLVSFPRVCKNRAFKPETEDIEWNDNPKHFTAWCEGRTGYPIVDAGMRQLNSIGWMHNRLRMVVAMFLTKDLLINWQKGERYFMNHLVDGDFASNNGGWQWAASTGTDSQPYFRIFNPALQSERFDKNGDFIRKWVPELKPVKGKAIHEPYKHLSPSEFKKLGYPKPIIDHSKARQTTLAAFKAIAKK
ncbi:DNA photolyase [Basidiobolus meristosporus CBS 931.73]|uniref:DNA photolyase n=1 Tax=Basidiobolus meristosporus CBS 931.73 TaxID=1314790 RepID=A0A1Y1YI77_9FUNG|nr:DNA photolyase [Basidiobolus meristosporus CBS 931.73]|eukprot:ORX97314.1 DNA photolyase [Basidiobolus meristosporus CBS 931.73]